MPIEAGWTPNVHVQVDLVGASDRQTDKLKGNEEAAGRMPAVPGKRPAFASGALNLSIPPLDRKLTVTATPRDLALEPGGETSISVQVSAANGGPVNGSEVAVVVVDESVLALTNYQLDDPLSVFYYQRDADTRDYHSRKDLVLGHSAEEKEQFIEEFWRRTGGGGPGGGGGGGLMAARSRLVDLPLNGRNFSGFSLLMPGVVSAKYGRSSGAIVNIVTKSGTNEFEPGIRLRDTFNALVVFAPAVRTDANGRAQVQVKLPDNLTRYRVMAVAVAGGKQFGSGESAITTRMPLMVRPSAPRFLNFGDQFELPIVVQNQTDSAITVDLAVRATNALLSEPPAVAGGSPAGQSDNSSVTRPLPQAVLTGRRVLVPANDRVEVRIPGTTAKPGTARFQVAAVSGSLSDAAEIELPVWTPATTEAFATYGELDDGAIVQETIDM